jgi:ribosomal protein L11 methylase PrmA
MRVKLLTLVPALVLLAAAQDSAPRHALDVPYVPTADNVVTAMLNMAGVKSTDVVYDLGCGDGRIVVAAARDFGAHGVGVDIDPQRIQEANAAAKSAGVEKLVRFEENDLFDAKISDATVVTLYLLPSINLKLRPKLLKDLKPGTRIVSHSFDMGDWAAEKQDSVDGATIYLWTVPEKK